MKIYLACCFDRHIDPVIKPFSTLEAAIGFAKTFCKKNARFPTDITERELPGWVFHATYSNGEDYVFVVQENLLMEDASSEK